MQGKPTEAGGRRPRPYPAYSDSGVDWLNQIPAHWEIAPIYARYEVALGKMLDQKRITGRASGRYIRNVNVQWDRVGTEDLPEMDFAPAERERYRLREGDLLVCEGGEVGRTATWRGELADCYYQKAVHRVRPHSENETPRFFFYMMYSLAKRGVFVAGGNSNTIDHLTAVQLKHYRFTFPPPVEQRAIAAFLDRETAKVDALVAKKERLIGLLQEKRTALITRAVTKGLHSSVPMKDSRVEWLGKIPSHWTVKKIKGLVRAPLAYGVLKPDKYAGSDGIRLVRILDIEAGAVLDEQLERVSPAQSLEYRRTVVAPGDLVVSVVGTIGRCFVVPDAIGGANLSRALARMQLRLDVNTQFIEHCLAARPFLTFTQLIPAGTAQRVLNLGDLGNYALGLPDSSEQAAIVRWLATQLKRFDSLIAQVHEAIDRLHELRTALVSAAVTGKIDVREEAIA